MPLACDFIFFQKFKMLAIIGNNWHLKYLNVLPIIRQFFLKFNMAAIAGETSRKFGPQMLEYVRSLASVG